MEIRTARFDRRSATERLAEAEKFERLAERFNSNPKLSRAFEELAVEARQQVQELGA